MDIEKSIEEKLSTEHGLKKLIRGIVYKAVRPLLKEYESDILHLYKQHDIRVIEHHDRVANLEINIRNNNDAIKDLQTYIAKLDNQSQKILDYTLSIGEEVKKKTLNYENNSIITNSDNAISSTIKDVSNSTDEDSYTGIDYFDFENRFRGSRDHIKKVQEQYLPYFQGRKKVVDVGCGRGEFLELLIENNIGAIGVDLYGKSIECCKMLDLDVLQVDAIEYIRKCDKIDGVFAGQLVEHLTMPKIIQLCEVAYEKLEEGSYMILETPNPTSLAIYTHAFYMDPSHGKPIHPLTLQYCAEKAGFKEVKILYTDSSKLPVKIPMLIGNNIENLREFNEAMEIVSGTLFGSQDYAIIAKK